MKNKRPTILITDREVAPTEAFRIAEARERHRQRMQTFTRWTLGHALEIESNNDGAGITVAVNGQKFFCERLVFPSEEFIANIALALVATPGNFDIGDIDIEHYLSVASHPGSTLNRGAAIAQAYENYVDFDKRAAQIINKVGPVRW